MQRTTLETKFDFLLSVGVDGGSDLSPTASGARSADSKVRGGSLSSAILSAYLSTMTDVLQESILVYNSISGIVYSYIRAEEKSMVACSCTFFLHGCDFAKDRIISSGEVIDAAALNNSLRRSAKRGLSSARLTRIGVACAPAEFGREMLYVLDRIRSCVMHQDSGVKLSRNKCLLPPAGIDVSLDFEADSLRRARLSDAVCGRDLQQVLPRPQPLQRYLRRVSQPRRVL